MAAPVSRREASRIALEPATWPREDAASERLLHLDPNAGLITDGRVGDLPGKLRAGDLLVVNDSATLPASLHGESEGRPVELRLLGGAAGEGGGFRALLLGAGDHRQRTEDRPAPPRLAAGARIDLGPELFAIVMKVSDESPRLLEVAFSETGARLWSLLYRVGRPIQYAYLAGSLPLWHAQTRFAARPWSAEMPSAGRPLAWGVLLAALKKGVAVASLTHAAGISSTGDAALDALFPLPERFDIPAATVSAIARTKANGGRVIAAGTTVTRALEGSAAEHGGAPIAGEGTTDLRLGPATKLRVVDGLFTGMHEPGTSHHRLLEAFAPRRLLDRAHARAASLGYLGHEMGDSMLILAS